MCLYEYSLHAELEGFRSVRICRNDKEVAKAEAMKFINQWVKEMMEWDGYTREYAEGRIVIWHIDRTKPHYRAEFTRLPF